MVDDSGGALVGAGTVVVKSSTGGRVLGVGGGVACLVELEHAASATTMRGTATRRIDTNPATITIVGLDKEATRDAA
ncbi:MAG TPA: hypothetical protein VFR41_14895 [Acidimicrobiia bacterium]|nr:hypothetical protein [Acidimicrobiia bacterium]